MVGQAGLEPAMPVAPDLQSGGVANFPTDPDNGAICESRTRDRSMASCCFTTKLILHNLSPASEDDRYVPTHKSELSICMVGAERLELPTSNL